MQRETVINITREELTAHNKTNNTYWKIHAAFVGRKFEPSEPFKH